MLYGGYTGGGSATGGRMTDSEESGDAYVLELDKWVRAI